MVFVLLFSTGCMKDDLINDLHEGWEDNPDLIYPTHHESCGCKCAEDKCLENCHCQCGKDKDTDTENVPTDTTWHHGNPTGGGITFTPGVGGFE